MTARPVAVRSLGRRTDLSKTLAEARKPFQSRPVEEFRFYSYATRHWLHHILYVSGRDMTIRTLSVSLIKRSVFNGHFKPTDWRDLAWAAENGNEAIVKLLISLEKVGTNSMDQSGLTPLWWALQNGHEAVVKLLLETGQVEVESKDNSGQTPLWWAARNGHEAVVKLLLETGQVDVESKDSYSGRTPLSWAAINGHEAVVKLLLETGQVDVESKDNSGQTPLSWAARNGHEAVVKLLQDHISRS